MRWNKPKSGLRKVRVRFAWFPTWLDRDSDDHGRPVVWLERYIQVYESVDRFITSGDTSWRQRETIEYSKEALAIARLWVKKMNSK
jgi:hypothetical protein